jgi:hypothetical protein
MKIIKNILSLAFAAALLMVGCSNSDDNSSTNLKKYTGLVINEVAGHEQTTDAESWVEILNTSSESIKLDGLSLYLFDQYFNGKAIYTGSGSLAAGARLVLTTTDESLSSGFASNAQFKLVLGTAKNKVVDEFSRETAFATPSACYVRGSYQRIPDGIGEWKNLSYTSKGEENKVFALSDYKNNAVWLWSTYMNEWMADDCKIMKHIKALGYDHILLNYAGFDNNPAIAKQFITKAEACGLVVHAWIQCFHTSAGWVNPIDDTAKKYKQEVFDNILAHARTYIEDFGVKGLHLDYIRFGGKAYTHNYSEVGVTADGAVTEFCRQIRELVNTYDEGIVLSAALMAEDESADVYYYGQDMYGMGKYIDIFMPMIYRYQDSGTSYGDSWCQQRANMFAANNGIAKVWAGIQTYEYPGGSIAGLSAERALSDINVFKSTKATGIVLFRYGYGDFPDVNNAWTVTRDKND